MAEICGKWQASVLTTTNGSCKSRRAHACKARAWRMLKVRHYIVGKTSFIAPIQAHVVCLLCQLTMKLTTTTTGNYLHMLHLLTTRSHSSASSALSFASLMKVSSPRSSQHSSQPQHDRIATEARQNCRDTNKTDARRHQLCERETRSRDDEMMDECASKRDNKLSVTSIFVADIFLFVFAFVAVASVTALGAPTATELLTDISFESSNALQAKHLKTRSSASSSSPMVSQISSNDSEARAAHWSLPNRPSLFSIIRFPNEECFDSSNQSGTCYTAFECKLLGGQPSSPCAAGFGSCCIVTRTCHTSTREKVVYFKNPSFPSADSEEEICDLTVEVSDANVCQLRLDFLDFQLDPPVRGACNDDYLEISASGMQPQTVPRLCGLNRNQHSK